MTQPQSPPQRPSLGEWFGRIVRTVHDAVVSRGCASLLTPSEVARIGRRLKAIRLHFERLAAAIAAGTYRARSPAAARRAPVVPPVPPPPDWPMRERGWLAALLPDTAAQHRSHLRDLLQDSGMATLMEQAPVSLVRSVRSLCFMLKLDPPKTLLALPKRPGKPKAAPEQPKTPENRKPRKTRKKAKNPEKPDIRRHRTDPPRGVPEWMSETRPGSEEPWFPDSLYKSPVPKTR